MPMFLALKKLGNGSIDSKSNCFSHPLTESVLPQISTGQIL
jgi:hypothetical protein